MDLPDRIAHGFLSASGLGSMGLGKVRCYQFEEFHTGFTLFSPDESTIVYVQMYGLPDGEEKLAADLAFQTAGKGWGNAPKPDVLALNIFPPDWTHTAFSNSPKRIVHLYRGPRRAVFIRYTGKLPKLPLFMLFNDQVQYLPDDWHLELVGAELVAPAPAAAPTPTVAPAGSVEAIDLRAELPALRAMILEGIARFAAEQRAAGGDVQGLPVTALLVYFDIGNGYASLNVDVRSPSEVDGSYSHQEYASVPRDNWRLFIDRFCDGHAVTLTGLDGKTTKVPAGSAFDFDSNFGAMVVQLVKSLLREGAFKPMLIGEGAEIFVEPHDSEFSWPSKAERRAKVNAL